jgi:hypothetical protein
MNLQPLFGRRGEVPVLPKVMPGKPGCRALTPEVVARVNEAVCARPVEDLPSSYAQPIYAMLVAHGFDRRDVLALAASLVDLVTSDVRVPSVSPDVG